MRHTVPVAEQFKDTAASVKVVAVCNIPTDWTGGLGGKYIWHPNKYWENLKVDNARALDFVDPFATP